MGTNDGTLYKKKANDQYIYTDNRIKMMFVLNPDFRKLGAPDPRNVFIQPISDSSYTNCKVHPFCHGYEYFMKFNILNSL
jgi:hypothetical protein